MISNRTGPLHLLAALAGAAALAACSSEPRQTSSVAKPAPLAAAADDSLLERFMKIRTPGAATLLPDGTLFVRDWPDGVFQLYRVPGGVAKPGAPAEKLTAFPDGAGGYSISPDGTRLLVTAAVGGNENSQIYTLDPKAPAGATPTPITSNPKVQYAPNLWLPDSTGFIYTGNEESPNDFYLYRHDFSSDAAGKKTRLLAKEGTWSAASITDDTSRLLVGHFLSASNSEVYELTVSSGELRNLTITPRSAGEQTTAANSIVGYMPGETSALIISDAEGGIPTLYLRDLASGDVTKPLPQLAGKEIDEADINRERSLLAVITNEDGYGVLHAFELPSFREIKLPSIDRGVVSGVSLRGRRITWSLSNAQTPGLAYSAEIPQRSDANSDALAVANPRQITFTDTQGIDLSQFPLPSLVRYPSFDGQMIPAFVYVPRSHAKGTPIPFIVLYHGGPESQHRPLFSSTLQYFLTQGIGIMMPNVRGSTGYGRAFHMMDDYKKRWDSVRDGVDAAKWLVESKYATPGRIATMGGSYGGFMSVACLIEDEERVERGEQRQRYFGAGIDNVGIVNMKTFLEQTSGYRRKLREVEYGPLTDPEFLASVSPLNKIDKIKVPMMIGHGLNDPRVPVGEAMQLAVGLQRRGFDPELVFFSDEGHGAQKLENRLLYSQRAARFLKRTIAN